MFLINLIAEIYCITGFRKLWGLIAADIIGWYIQKCSSSYRPEKKPISGWCKKAADHINRAFLELCKWTPWQLMVNYSPLVKPPLLKWRKLREGWSNIHVQPADIVCHVWAGASPTSISHSLFFPSLVRPVKTWSETFIAHKQARLLPVLFFWIQASSMKYFLYLKWTLDNLLQDTQKVILLLIGTFIFPKSTEIKKPSIS